MCFLQLPEFYHQIAPYDNRRFVSAKVLLYLCPPSSFNEAPQNSQDIRHLSSSELVSNNADKGDI